MLALAERLASEPSLPEGLINAAQALREQLQPAANPAGETR